jgi:hypothetical protein
MYLDICNDVRSGHRRARQGTDSRSLDTQVHSIGRQHERHGVLEDQATVRASPPKHSKERRCRGDLLECSVSPDGKPRSLASEARAGNLGSHDEAHGCGRGGILRNCDRKILSVYGKEHTATTVNTEWLVSMVSKQSVTSKPRLTPNAGDGQRRILGRRRNLEGSAQSQAKIGQKHDHSSPQHKGTPDKLRHEKMSKRLRHCLSHRPTFQLSQW